MSLLDSLGLGFAIGSYQRQLGQAPPIQSYPHIVYHCKHGVNCPLCEAETNLRANERMELHLIEEKKKEEYKERCKAYVLKFKKKLKQIKGAHEDNPSA